MLREKLVFFLIADSDFLNNIPGELKFMLVVQFQVVISIYG